MRQFKYFFIALIIQYLYKCTYTVSLWYTGGKYLQLTVVPVHSIRNDSICLSTFQNEKWIKIKFVQIHMYDCTNITSLYKRPNSAQGIATSFIPIIIHITTWRYYLKSQGEFAVYMQFVCVYMVSVAFN